MLPKVALLIIDAQYDFCDPNGTLYVPGSEKDMERLSKFIIHNQNSIDSIVLSMDAHPYTHISHPCYWSSREDKNPDPFTLITLEDIHNQTWKPTIESEYSISYIRLLEEQGQFKHVIWPYHCIAGTKGFMIVEYLMEAIKQWSLKKLKPHKVIFKGTNPFTEQYGIFSANIPHESYKETQPNYELLNFLSDFDSVYVAGEARSHCVATSIQQIIDFKPELVQKLIIMQDCMSDVPGFENQGKAIYNKAIQMGAKIVNSDDSLK